MKYRLISTIILGCALILSACGSTQESEATNAKEIVTEQLETESEALTPTPTVAPKEEVLWYEEDKDYDAVLIDMDDSPLLGLYLTDNVAYSATGQNSRISVHVDSNSSVNADLPLFDIGVLTMPYSNSVFFEKYITMIFPDAYIADEKISTKLGDMWTCIVPATSDTMPIRIVYMSYKGNIIYIEQPGARSEDESWVNYRGIDYDDDRLIASLFDESITDGLQFSDAVIADTDASDETTLAKETKETQDSEMYNTPTDFLIDSYVDYYGDTYTLHASNDKPLPGTVLHWSGASVDAYNQLAALNSAGHIDYNKRIETITYVTIPEDYAKYGVCMWINAAEYGYDRVIFWYPDGTIEVNPLHN